MTWLDPLRAALDAAERPVDFFLRDDDAGWDDERLFALLDVCGDYGLPIDLAVIPQALGPSVAAALVDRAEDDPGSLGLHQHGFAHTNHEPSGRKHEFGPSRGYRAQRQDIAEGQRRLRELLGPHLDPIFTPPWNRSTQTTADCLVELGFVALSREARAEAIEAPGLTELPVSVDWFAHHRGTRLAPAEVASLAARATESAEPVGIMFHHAVMPDDELGQAAELLSLLSEHRQTIVRPMRELLAAAAVPSAPAY